MTADTLFHILRALRRLKIQVKVPGGTAGMSRVALAALGGHARVLRPPTQRSPAWPLLSWDRDESKGQRQMSPSLPVVLSLSLSLFSHMELISAC